MGNRKRCLNLFKSPQGPGAPLGWESAFGEDSGLPTLTLVFTLRLYFTHLQGPLLPLLPLTLHLTHTTSTHFFLLLLLLLCYGAHLVCSSGTVSSRNSRRAEHPAEARRKLRESTAEAQLIHSYAARCRES